MCGCLSCASYLGSGPQPRHVPWLGIEPATLWFTGLHSIHSATPTRALVHSHMYGFFTLIVEDNYRMLLLDEWAEKVEKIPVVNKHNANY